MEASGEDSSQLTPFERRGAVLAQMLAAGVVLVQCTAGQPPPAAGLSHRFTEGKAAKRAVVVQLIPRRRIHGTPQVVVPA